LLIKARSLVRSGVTGVGNEHRSKVSNEESERLSTV